MKFCIYGAGAIGGCLAVELASAGHDVCVIARGPHLKAIQERGLILRIGGREKVARVAADEDIERSKPKAEGLSIEDFAQRFAVAYRQ